MISLGAEANVCRTPKTEDNGKTTFCFFSLNNTKEFHTLGKDYAGGEEIKDKAGNLVGYKKGNMEIREFYGSGSASESVEKKFKNMLKNNECDSLVISGHHTGYFAGEKSIHESSDSEILDLDFMEELSCEEGCDKWFSNVKSLFLMGCQTVKTPDNLKEDSDSPDSEMIRVIIENKEETNEHNKTINQAYSSTLDQNNKLSHRYLRMFPNSSLYGWGEKAPSARSEQSLPNFIDLVGKLQREGGAAGSPSSTENDILKVIDFMNQSDRTKKCLVADKWTKHWVSLDADLSDEAVFTATQATACYLEDQTQFVSNQKLGCDLTKALKMDDGNEIKGNKIKTAVENILEAGTKRNGAINEEVRGEAIRANFNRLMSLITNKKNKKQGWYKDVVEQLSSSKSLRSAIEAEIMPPADNDSQSNKVGFVRKSDYLYFYREMGWSDKDKDKEISAAFLTQLQTAFTNVEKERALNAKGTEAFHLSLLNSIGENGLQEWLYKNSSTEFNNLFKKYSDVYSTPPEGDSLVHIINGTVKYLKSSIQ